MFFIPPSCWNYEISRKLVKSTFPWLFREIIIIQPRIVCSEVIDTEPEVLSLIVPGLHEWGAGDPAQEEDPAVISHLIKLRDAFLETDV